MYLKKSILFFLFGPIFVSGVYPMKDMAKSRVIKEAMRKLPEKNKFEGISKSKKMKAKRDSYVKICYPRQNEWSGRPLMGVTDYEAATFVVKRGAIFNRESAKEMEKKILKEGVSREMVRFYTCALREGSEFEKYILPDFFPRTILEGDGIAWFGSYFYDDQEFSEAITLSYEKLKTNVNYQHEKSGESLLMRMVFWGKLAAVKTLLKLGANVNLLDWQGRSAIDYAALGARRANFMIEFLSVMPQKFMIKQRGKLVRYARCSDKQVDLQKLGNAEQRYGEIVDLLNSYDQLQNQ